MFGFTVASAAASASATVSTSSGGYKSKKSMSKTNTRLNMIMSQNTYHSRNKLLILRITYIAWRRRKEKFARVTVILLDLDDTISVHH